MVYRRLSPLDTEYRHHVGTETSAKADRRRRPPFYRSLRRRTCPIHLRLTTPYEFAGILIEPILFCSMLPSVASLPAISLPLLPLRQWRLLPQITQG